MIEAVQPISDQLATEASRAKGPDMQALSDQFNRLMAKEPDPSVYSEQHLSSQQTPAAAFVHAQEQVMRATFEEVRATALEAPHMDMAQLAIRHMELTSQLAMVQLQFNAGVYLAQSSKSGIQTLMKNQ